MKYHKPTLTLFCGLPGSGKTRIAKQIEKKTNAIRICTDDWLTDIGADLFDETIREALQQRLYTLALQLVSRGQDVILEDGLWSKKERDEKLSSGRKLNARVYIHVFDLSPNEQWKRIEHRNNNLRYGYVPITRKQLDSYFPMFEKPELSELEMFDNYTIYADHTPLSI